jgi:hypothetical protein
MNLVNGLLSELLGSGIPHLVLDQLALGFCTTAYTELFSRAVASWAVPGSPLERYRALTHGKQRYFALLGRLTSVETEQAATSELRASPEDARLALFGA